MSKPTAATAAAALAIAALAGTAAADVESHTIEFDYDLFSAYESPTFPKFDTQGGTRTLEGMTIAFDHSVDMVLTLENVSPFAVAADVYSFEYYFNVLFQLGTAEDEDDNPPFMGPGGFSAQFGVDLPAYSGDWEPGPGLPGGEAPNENVFFSDVLTSSVSLAFDYDAAETPEFLEAVTGTGELQTVLGGFTETGFYWLEDVGTDGLIFAGADSVRHYGSFTITYEFTAGGCSADRDGDGDSDVQDLLAYLRAFRTGTADTDGDEDTDVQDLLGYLRAFRTGC